MHSSRVAPDIITAGGSVSTLSTATNNYVSRNSLGSATSSSSSSRFDNQSISLRQLSTHGSSNSLVQMSRNSSSKDSLQGIVGLQGESSRSVNNRSFRSSESSRSLNNQRSFRSSKLSELQSSTMSLSSPTNSRFDSKTLPPPPMHFEEVLSAPNSNLPESPRSVSYNKEFGKSSKRLSSRSIASARSSDSKFLLRKRFRVAIVYVLAILRFKNGPLLRDRAEKQGYDGGQQPHSFVDPGGGKSQKVTPRPSYIALWLASGLCGGRAALYISPSLALIPAGTRRFPTFITPYMLLGDAVDAENLKLLKSLGVTHVLNAAASLPEPHKESFLYLHLPLDDNASQTLGDHLVEALAFIEDARYMGGVVLVHCAMGISRSVSCSVAHLVHPAGGNMNLANAMSRVVHRRPQALPNMGFRVQLAVFEIECRGSSSVLELETVHNMWDIREWRTHPMRLKELAKREESNAEKGRLGWWGRLKRRLF